MRGVGEVLSTIDVPVGHEGVEQPARSVGRDDALVVVEAVPGVEDASVSVVDERLTEVFGLWAFWRRFTVNCGVKVG